MTMSTSDRRYRDADWLRERYVEAGRSMAQIGEECDVSASTILDWLRRHDIPTRPQPGSEPPKFHTMTDKSYERWRQPDGDRTAVVYVHRLAAIAWFGFDAVADNHVHHRNHLGWDTRRENLELLSPRDHGAYHARANARRDDGAFA